MTLVRFPDPVPLVRDALLDLLPASGAHEADGVVVSTRAPDLTTGARALPHVQVISDGRFRDARLDGRATIRVAVWHRDVGLGELLAELAQAQLLAGGLPGIRSVTAGTGPFASTDPDVEDQPLSYFTVTVRVPPAS
jgi:hypothetical protein